MFWYDTAALNRKYTARFEGKKKVSSTLLRVGDP